MKVKGTVLRSSMVFLRENFPAKMVEHILGDLTEEEREVLIHPLQMAHWYEIEILQNLMRAMTTGTHETPERLFHRLGRWSCEDGFDAVSRIFLKVHSPAFLLKHAPQVWRNFYDRGQIILLASTARSAHLRLAEARFAGPAMCFLLSGWMERAVELSGGREVRLEHAQCVHVGDPACEWLAEWEGA